MDEVRFATVNPVVMALVAQSQPVTDIVSQFRVVSNRFHMMGHESFTCPTMLAFVSVPFEYSGFPGQILGTTSTLIWGLVGALGEPLAFHAAIDMGTCTLAGRTNKLGLAHLTGIGLQRDPTSVRAVDLVPDMGWGPEEIFPAGLTSANDFLALGQAVALSATEAF